MQTPQSPQIRVEQVSLASGLLASKSGQAHKRPLAEGYYLLQSISFEVLKGDFIAIVGPSGAGKTSLLRLLNRLSEPTDGAIYLNDAAFKQISPIQLRQQVVLVLQESKLLGMTVQEALEYPLKLRKFSRETIAQRVEAWVERLQIPLDWLGRTELQLSVGQRQLVAIARALVLQPQILLLDEPTSSLDLGRANQLLRVLRELTETGELTVLMANHQLELAKFCTRVLHLQQGRLIQDLRQEQMDWNALQRSLMQAEAQQIEEWEE